MQQFEWTSKALCWVKAASLKMILIIKYSWKDKITSLDARGLSIKGYNTTVFWDDGTVLYPDCGSCYMSQYMYENSQNYAPEKSQFYCITIFKTKKFVESREIWGETWGEEKTDDRRRPRRGELVILNLPINVSD